MDIIIETFFGEGTGVVDDLLGERKETVLIKEDDKMYLIGKVLCAVSQGFDVKITQYAEKGDE